jgi:hypothetical protein
MGMVSCVEWSTIWVCFLCTRVEQGHCCGQHPIPKQTDILQALSGAQYLLVFNTLSGFTRPEKLDNVSLPQKHIGDVLACFNMTDAQPVSTPLAKSVPLTKEDCPQSDEDLEYMKSVPFLLAVGNLMYLAVGTHPDIAFAVGALSRFNANPGRAHWKQVQHVFKYLAGTWDLMLCYGPGADSTCLQIYSDADYAGDVDSACSTSGHAVFIGKCLVLQWKNGNS